MFTRPPSSINCHQSELQIFLLFSRSLSSLVTDCDAVEELCDELSFVPGKNRKKTQLQCE